MSVRSRSAGSEVRVKWMRSSFVVHLCCHSNNEHLSRCKADIAYVQTGNFK